MLLVDKQMIVMTYHSLIDVNPKREKIELCIIVLEIGSRRTLFTLPLIKYGLDNESRAGNPVNVEKIYGSLRKERKN